MFRLQFIKLDKQIFDSMAKLAAVSPRLRMNYDLRDSEDEDGPVSYTHLTLPTK